MWKCIWRGKTILRTNSISRLSIHSAAFRTHQGNEGQKALLHEPWDKKALWRIDYLHSVAVKWDLKKISGGNMLDDERWDAMSQEIIKVSPANAWYVVGAAGGGHGCVRVLQKGSRGVE